MTGYAIGPDDVHPNLALYAAIEDWVTSHAASGAVVAELPPLHF